MGKIYLKKVKAIQRNSCLGCYFFNESQSFFAPDKFTCNETHRKECHKRFIFKQEFKSAPNEIIEDREISYSHKTYDGPGAQGCYHNLPPYVTTGVSGMPRTGNENMLACHVCKHVLPIEDFKKVIINAPGHVLLIAYTCRTCGNIRIKPEDLKD